MAGARETTLSDATSLTISGAHKNDGNYVSGWERGLTNRKDARKAYQSSHVSGAYTAAVTALLSR